MNRSRADELQETVFGVCMVLAPILLLISSVVSGVGSSGLGGTIHIYAFLLWIPVVLGLSGLLWDRAPRFAVIGRLLGIFGCFGGIGYGMAPIFQTATAQAGASEAVQAEFATILDTGLPLILNVPGITFPLSMVLFGIVLWRSRAVPARAGTVLALGGVMFPITRIPDIQMLFYIPDTLFVVSLGYIGVRRYLRPTVSETSARAT